MITLTQDAGDKINVKMVEVEVLSKLKKFFGWRNVSMERFNKLGTRDHDRFIKYLSGN